MFIDDFVPVARNIVVANAWLISHGDEIASVAAHATAPTEVVQLGPPRTRLDSLVVPIVWSLRSPSPLTDLQGDLQTSPLDPRSTHLSLTASCHIPIALPGRRAQELAARRTAENSVLAFLGRLAGELEGRSADGVPLSS